MFRPYPAPPVIIDDAPLFIDYGVMRDSADVEFRFQQVPLIAGNPDMLSPDPVLRQKTVVNLDRRLRFVGKNFLIVFTFAGDSTITR